MLRAGSNNLLNLAIGETEQTRYWKRLSHATVDIKAQTISVRLWIAILTHPSSKLKKTDAIAKSCIPTHFLLQTERKWPTLHLSLPKTLPARTRRR